MPNWVKHVLWALLVIILIARWRDLAGCLKGLGGSIGGLFRDSALRFEAPVYKFAVFGVIVVAITALWAIYWNNRSGRTP